MIRCEEDDGQYLLEVSHVSEWLVGVHFGYQSSDIEETMFNRGAG